MTTNAQCRSCGAPIIWAKTQGGKNIPLDAEPGMNGNILLSNGIAIYCDPIDPDFYDGLSGENQRYVSHFATCPNAEKHRKK
jgi:hypothetical protein